jgi:predicted nucleic acid-binding protein
MPTLVLFEVYKKIAVTLSEDQALAAVATLSQYTVTDLSRDIALAAADISIQNRLGMADSIVLAHAREAGALLITLDNYFNGIQGAQVLRK